MAKVATSLFEFIPGADVEPPTDEVMRALDANRKSVEALAAIGTEMDALCERMKFLPPQFRLTAAKRMARGMNSTSRAFNVAVFIAEKEEEQAEDLFKDPAPVLGEVELF